LFSSAAAPRHVAARSPAPAASRVAAGRAGAEQHGRRHADGSSLPGAWRTAFKTFHLIAEPLVREFAPGFKVNCWGYNGRAAGPTIEAVEGDRLRIYVENRLPEPTTIHWHGVLLPNGMDGVAGLTQPPSRRADLQVRVHGAPARHADVPPALRRDGAVLDGHDGLPDLPSATAPRRIDRDFAIFLNEWFIKPGTSTPDPR
jgi:FtsP/CotA-like multicopper oxidase with cupredoxin domain